MSTLAIVGMTFLAVMVGFTLGVRFTARRYQQALSRRVVMLDDFSRPSND